MAEVICRDVISTAVLYSNNVELPTPALEAAKFGIETYELCVSLPSAVFLFSFTLDEMWN
jgi:hypothetical protein